VRMRRLAWATACLAFVIVAELSEGDVNSDDVVRKLPEEVERHASVDEIMPETQGDDVWARMRKAFAVKPEVFRGQSGLGDSIAKLRKADFEASQHKDGFDEWRDQSLLGVLTDTEVMSKEDKDHARHAVQGLFSRFEQGVETEDKTEHSQILAKKVIIPSSHPRKDTTANSVTSKIGLPSKHQAPPEEKMIGVKAQASDGKKQLRRVSATKKGSATPKDVLPGLFHEALQVDEENEKKIHEDKAPRTAQTKQPEGQHTPPADISAPKDKRDAEEEEGDQAQPSSSEGSSSSRLHDIAAKQKMLISKELAKPLNDETKPLNDETKPVNAKLKPSKAVNSAASTSRKQQPQPIMIPADRLQTHGDSSSAASEAVIAAKKAVGALESMKASADADVARSNAQLKVLEKQHSARTDADIMKEAKKSAAKTIARLNKEDEEQHEKQTAGKENEVNNGDPQAPHDVALALPEISEMTGITEQMVFSTVTSTMMNSPTSDNNAGK